jgi:ABC-2 type transport system ATP-binding protein
MSAILADGLTKYFKSLCAVDGVSFEVDREIFGLLGPNGAGKSTIVKMLTTLLRPTGGKAYVCGHDVEKESVMVRESLSYVPQEMAVDIKLTGRENVLLYAHLYHVPNPKDRTDQAIALMELSDRANELVRGYSGGMRRRLELAQALVHEPLVLFLDEPTLGLDVAARKKIWEHIGSLKKKGMTIFMTTHYMDEADRYCDRVAIIDKGRIVAMDTTEALKGSVGGDVIIASVSGEFRAFEMEGVRLLGVEEHELKFMAENGNEALPLISRELMRQGLEVHSVSVRGSTLEDVFLKKVASREESAAFDGTKYRLMLRRRG